MSDGHAPTPAPPLLVAAAVVVEDGRVLLTKRLPKGHLPGKWEFPGGKVEPGEAPAATVVREVREETSLEIEVIDILEVSFHRFPHPTRKDGPTKDVLLLFYECRRLSGAVQHLQVADHAWVAPREVRGKDLPPADAGIVAKIEARWG